MNYWLVGATIGGADPQDERFVREGMWMLYWKKGSQAEKAKQVEIGDRIAIKRLKGKGQQGIRILHIGIVRGVVRETSNIVCVVDWVATDLNRDIGESRGCFGAVNGPFEQDDWIREIFCL